MMSLLLLISDFIIPVTVLVIILFGCAKKVDIYDAFVEGAKEGLQIVIDILPTLMGLMVAVAVLRSSGALDGITAILRPLASAVGFPAEVVPIGLMRLVSSSAALGLLVDLFQSVGPDSFSGRLASIMMSCTETVFYTMSVYFMSVKIRKTKYTLSGALIANGAGIVAAFYITYILFAK